MQTHDDGEHRDFIGEWFKSLENKAERMQAAGKSKITAGVDGEPILAEWESRNIIVRHMPPDEHDILRISIGGGKHTPVELNYCVFRGNRGECIDLLRKALKSMEDGPGHHN